MDKKGTEGVTDEANLVEALQRVCANKGSGSIDRMYVTKAESMVSPERQREAEGTAQRNLPAGAGPGSANSQTRRQRGPTKVGRKI